MTRLLFATELYKNRNLLQKRPDNVESLLIVIVATPYVSRDVKKKNDRAFLQKIPTEISLFQTSPEIGLFKIPSKIGLLSKGSERDLPIWGASAYTSWPPHADR